MAEKKNLHIDRRTADRYVERGVFSKTDYQAHLKALPDDTANAEWVHMELHDAELASEDLDGDEDSEDKE